MKKNLIFVRGNESNTIIVLNQGANRIEDEITFENLKNGRSIVDFEVDPVRGDIVALSTSGDVLIRGGEDAARDAYLEAKTRAGERFRAVAVDW